MKDRVKQVDIALEEVGQPQILDIAGVDENKF
jgi:hypothetical protein